MSISAINQILPSLNRSHCGWMIVPTRQSEFRYTVRIHLPGSLTAYDAPPASTIGGAWASGQAEIDRRRAKIREYFAGPGLSPEQTTAAIDVAHLRALGGV